MLLINFLYKFAFFTNKYIHFYSSFNTITFFILYNYKFKKNENEKEKVSEIM